jgi:hypothetical protein
MTQALEAVLTELSKVKDGFNEDDIERLFQNVYLELGYKTVGRDILGKRKSKKSGIPDVRLLNSDDSIQVIVELKKPELAKFVRRVLELCGTVDTQEFLALEVPINSKDQTRYLETLAAWESEVSVLSGEIEKLEAELNDVVYEVYGLNAADREVIEEFLKRF